MQISIRDLRKLIRESIDGVLAEALRSETGLRHKLERVMGVGDVLNGVMETRFGGSRKIKITCTHNTPESPTDASPELQDEYHHFKLENPELDWDDFVSLADIDRNYPKLFTIELIGHKTTAWENQTIDQVMKFFDRISFAIY